MNFGDLIFIALAGLNICMALSLARFLPRFWRELPWLVPLIAYFSVRALKRVLEIIDGKLHESAIDFFIDFILAGTLIALLLNSDNMIRGFQAIRDLASYRAAEYERAHRQYTQLVRHRIANPLTVILGSVQTLQQKQTSPEIEQELLANITTAALEIQDVSLAPQTQSDEERELDAIPNLRK